MYLPGSRTYYDGSGQFSPRHPFILLFSAENEPTIKFTVRKVKMRQLGHFMMGLVRIGGKTLSVSGMFGNDGLPMNAEELPAPLYANLPELPTEIANAYWKSDTSNEHLALVAIRDYVNDYYTTAAATNPKW